MRKRYHKINNGRYRHTDFVDAAIHYARVSFILIRLSVTAAVHNPLKQ
jgi:hypothetical protein